MRMRPQRLALVCRAHTLRRANAEQVLTTRNKCIAQVIPGRLQSFSTATVQLPSESQDLNSVRLALVDLKGLNSTTTGKADLSARIASLTSTWRQLRSCCDAIAASVPATGADHSALQLSHAKLHGAFLLFYDVLYSTAVELYGPMLAEGPGHASKTAYMASTGSAVFPVSSQEHLHAVALQSLVKEAPMIGVAYACPPDARAHARLVRVAGLRSVSAAQRCLNLYALGGSTLSQEAVMSFLRACVRHGNALSALPALFLMEERGWDVRNPEHAALGRCAGVGIRRQLALLEKLGRGKSVPTSSESASALVSAAEAAQVAASIRTHAVILGHLANVRLKRQVESGKKRMEGYRMTAQALAEMREALETVSAAEKAKKGAGSGEADGDGHAGDESSTGATLTGRTQAAVDAAQEKADAEATLQAALMQALAEVQQAELDAEADVDEGAEGDSARDGAAVAGSASEQDEEDDDSELSQDIDKPMDLADLRANRDELAAMLGFDPKSVSDEDLTDALAVALGTVPGGGSGGQPGDESPTASANQPGQVPTGLIGDAAATGSAASMGARAEHFASYKTRFKDAAAGLVHSACAQDAPDELLNASLQALEQLSVGFPHASKGAPDARAGAEGKQGGGLDWLATSTPSGSWPGASTEEARSSVLLPSASAVAIVNAGAASALGLEVTHTGQGSPGPRPYKEAVQTLVQARAQVLLLFGKYLLGLGTGQGSAPSGAVAIPTDPRLHMAAALPKAQRQALLEEVQGRLEAGLGGAVWGVHDIESVGPIGPAATHPSPAVQPPPTSGVSESNSLSNSKEHAVKGTPSHEVRIPAAVRKQLVAALLGACLSEQPVPTRSHVHAA